MAWTDFYMQTTGNDLNAGSTNADAAAFTYAAGTFVRATGVFTTAGENPLTDGVLVGDWVSIYTTAGATGATFVAQVDARDATTITVDITTHKLGLTTAVSESAGAATCKVGGAWASLVIVTSLFVSQTMTISTRINIKAGTYANTTTSRAFAAAGTTLILIWWRGYKASIGDLDDGITLPRSLQDGVNLPLITFTTGQITVTGAHQIFSNLDITSACVTTGGAFRPTSGNTKIILCRIENTANHTNARALSFSTAHPTIVIGCRLKSHTGASSVVSGDSLHSDVIYCHIIGGTIGVAVVSALTVTGCVIESFATSGISSTMTATGGMIVDRCSIYAAATNGILITVIPTSGKMRITNCIIGGCTNGITNDTGGGTNGIHLFRNHFYACNNNVVGITEMATFDADLGKLCRLIDDDTDPWVEKGTSDFTLAPTNNIDRASGYPGIFEGQTVMVGYPDIGAVSRFNQPHFGDKSGGKY